MPRDVQSGAARGRRVDVGRTVNGNNGHARGSRMHLPFSIQREDAGLLSLSA
ncbi:expressed unknown protein [Ectocarpus siliculosus]|uniref:Uncharacterized protein n=1 Tax=Ectocarpus siliculosus TaxID=2880 RepID=D8LCU5_ECTSI|nr:expressed unknown protein [Ectocarpus siliculosus]|eukprot:CBN75487.1 expressed unknown protein [Ectocarpus siliculosus]